MCNKLLSQKKKQKQTTKNPIKQPNKSNKIKQKRKIKNFKPHKTSRLTADPTFVYGQQIN